MSKLSPGLLNGTTIITMVIIMEGVSLALALIASLKRWRRF